MTAATSSGAGKNRQAGAPISTSAPAPASSFNVNFTGAAGNDTATTSLNDHVNALLADGRAHGFNNGYDSFKDRVKPAMDHLREKGIETSKAPHQAMQPAAN